MKTFLMIGMHRSATSLVAKGLSLAGVHVGDALLGAMPSNPYGHWEDVDFIAMNDWLLANAGGSWDNPPPEQAILEAGKRHEKDIVRLVRAKEREPLWGWKDPRNTLTARAYLPHLKNPHLVASFRDPLEVARSLAVRENWPPERGYNLAVTYHERLMRLLEDWWKIKPLS
ncbi:MAG: hypothetical protein JRJ78_13870 [Deltaproteobacteria bacterium]|nr:hypothetical protein [Deltaproteobacteria bacterium]